MAREPGGRLAIDFSLSAHCCNGYVISAGFSIASHRHAAGRPAGDRARRGQLPAARASARKEATCPVLPMTTMTSPPEICSSGGGLVRKSWPG